MVEQSVGLAWCSGKRIPISEGIGKRIRSLDSKGFGHWATRILPGVWTGSSCSIPWAGKGPFNVILQFHIIVHHIAGWFILFTIPEGNVHPQQMGPSKTAFHECNPFSGNAHARRSIRNSHESSNDIISP